MSPVRRPRTLRVGYLALALSCTACGDDGSSSEGPPRPPEEQRAPAPTGAPAPRPTEPVVPAARLAPTEIARYRAELARLLPPRITSPRKVVGVSGATGIDLTGFGTVVVSQRTAGGQMATRCADTVEEAIEFLSPTDPSPGLPVK